MEDQQFGWAAAACSAGIGKSGEKKQKNGGGHGGRQGNNQGIGGSFWLGVKEFDWFRLLLVFFEGLTVGVEPRMLI